MLIITCFKFEKILGKPELKYDTALGEEKN
jgi:hypothetical protein